MKPMKSISELASLEGRSAIVTGGAGHLGSAICETLMELGGNVSVLDIDRESCEGKAEELNSAGFRGSAHPFTVDLMDEEATRLAIRFSREAMGSIDILVHSAAFVGTTEAEGWAVPFEDQKTAAWDAAMRVNLTSAMVMAQECKPIFHENGKGSIILIGSIYGVVGPDNSLYEGTAMVTPAGYAASKGGLLQLGHYLSAILGPQIRVNTVTMGGIYRNQDECFVDRYAQRTPLKRMGTEEDIKGAIAYLASDLSAYVTGSNLHVDGGWTAW